MSYEATGGVHPLEVEREGTGEMGRGVVVGARRINANLIQNPALPSTLAMHVSGRWLCLPLDDAFRRRVLTPKSVWSVVIAPISTRYMETPRLLCRLAAANHQHFVAVGKHLPGVRQAFAGFTDG